MIGGIRLNRGCGVLSTDRTFVGRLVYRFVNFGSRGRAEDWHAPAASIRRTLDEVHNRSQTMKLRTLCASVFAFALAFGCAGVARADVPVVTVTNLIGEALQN